MHVYCLLKPLVCLIKKLVLKTHWGNELNKKIQIGIIGERSHMTSAAEGVGGFEMLTVADKGGRGSKPC